VSSDPIALLVDAVQRAQKAGAREPEAVALATATLDGAPSVRMVLFRGLREGGLAFFTNLESRKAAELEVNPRAALCFFWPEIGEQIRVEGGVRAMSTEEADRYWAQRPRGSQIGGWASKQSRRLESRDHLIDAVAEFERKFAGNEIPRPPFWSGYVLLPERIEFWWSRPDRLHERKLYERAGEGWMTTSLYP
jgi:pyridoxamine 5'-phosphate oxidase